MIYKKREVFDKVAKHLLDQGKVSMIGKLCAYRGSDGSSCAVGCLIPDELYDRSMEGKPVYLLIEKYPKISELFGEHLGLLKKLQSLHDRGFRDPQLVDRWDTDLQKILTDEVLNEQA